MAERTKPILGTDQSEGVDLTESEFDGLVGEMLAVFEADRLKACVPVVETPDGPAVIGIDEALAGDWERVAGDFSRAVQKAKP